MPTRITILIRAAEGLHTWLNPERSSLVVVELENIRAGLDTDRAECKVETTATLSNDQVSEQDWQDIDQS